MTARDTARDTNTMISDNVFHYIMDTGNGGKGLGS